MKSGSHQEVFGQHLNTSHSTGDKLYLSVYFEGTANTIHPSTTQIGLFFRHTKALDVTDPSTTVPRFQTNF